MSKTTNDGWSDADFETATPAHSVAELLTRISASLAEQITPIDDLRLLIQVRFIHGWREGDVTLELHRLGIDYDYASKLVLSTSRSPAALKLRTLRTLLENSPRELPPPQPQFQLTDWADPSPVSEPVNPPEGMRFTPEACPGCQTPVAAWYSRVRSGRRSRAFVPIVAASLLATFVLIVPAIWAGGELATWAKDSLKLKRRELGFVVSMAYLVCLVPIAFFVRGWLRMLHRLPREFRYECPTCHWSGLCLGRWTR